LRIWVLSESVRDYVSRDLLLECLESKEEHADFFVRQFDLIKQIRQTER
jgi:bacterioferritin (cytochrome b1)